MWTRMYQSLYGFVIKQNVCTLKSHLITRTIKLPNSFRPPPFLAKQKKILNWIVTLDWRLICFQQIDTSLFFVGSEGTTAFDYSELVIRNNEEEAAWEWADCSRLRRKRRNTAEMESVSVNGGRGWDVLLEYVAEWTWKLRKRSFEILCIICIELVFRFLDSVIVNFNVSDFCVTRCICESYIHRTTSYFLNDLWHLGELYVKLILENPLICVEEKHYIMLVIIMCFL